ncbi:MAG: class I SAM-dependent methyltransferase [Burkholderiales bacterium]|nr:class I SAM-dependent methyltransferase [Burkholderiales bacterium]
MLRSLLQFAVVACFMSLSAAQAADVGALLDQAIAGKHRTEADRARDVYRHPKETLLFFGFKPDQTVVEIWPTAGWFTDVIAPVLRDNGKLYVARAPVSSSKATNYMKERDKVFLAKLAARPEVYGKPITREIPPPEGEEVAPAGSADLVLTFRNVHNWARGGTTDEMFQTFFAMLKPGGVLGVEEHRARPGTPFADQVRTGYMTEEYVIETARKAGFELVDQAEINANPKDTKDYAKGVWTLPPTLVLGDENRVKYMAIGESDRMTLKFVKPFRQPEGTPGRE